jgi:hypothetical protein
MIVRCQFCLLSQHELFIFLLSMAYFIVLTLRCTTIHVKCVPVRETALYNILLFQGIIRNKLIIYLYLVCNMWKCFILIGWLAFTIFEQFGNGWLYLAMGLMHHISPDKTSKTLHGGNILIYLVYSISVCCAGLNSSAFNLPNIATLSANDKQYIHLKIHRSEKLHSIIFYCFRELLGINRLIYL